MNQKRLYFVKNNFEIPKRECIFDLLIPIDVNIVNEHEVWGESKYFYFYRDEKNISDKIELVLNDASNKLIQLQVIDSSQITFHEKKYDIKYLSLSSCIAINIISESFEKYYKYIPPIKFLVKIHVFTNVIIIFITDLIQPAYYFYEDILGVITDRYFNIVGFVINNIESENVELLKNFVVRRENIYNNIPSQFPLIDNEKIMFNKKFIIKKIIELENIDRWNVLFYGLERRLIDNKDIIDYAVEFLSQGKPADQFIIDIAGLLKHEIDKVPHLLNEKIGDKQEQIMVDGGQIYNKIWFYLSLADDMYSEKFIREPYV